MTNYNQELYRPTAYSFSREDIGRIVLFENKKNGTLIPHLIVFNNGIIKDIEDEILFKAFLGGGVYRTINYLVGDLNYDYVKIIDTESK